MSWISKSFKKISKSVSKLSKAIVPLVAQVGGAYLTGGASLAGGLGGLLGGAQPSGVAIAGVPSVSHQGPGQDLLSQLAGTSIGWLTTKLGIGATAHSSEGGGSASGTIFERPQATAPPNYLPWIIAGGVGIAALLLIRKA